MTRIATIPPTTPPTIPPIGALEFFFSFTGWLVGDVVEVEDCEAPVADDDVV